MLEATSLSLEATYPDEALRDPMGVQHFPIHLYGHLNYHLGQVNYHSRLIEGLI